MPNYQDFGFRPAKKESRDEFYQYRPKISEKQNHGRTVQKKSGHKEDRSYISPDNEIGKAM